MYIFYKEDVMKKLLFFILFNLLLIPVFAIEVSDFMELKYAINDGVNNIELADDITITSPLLISTCTTLTSIENSTFTVTGGTTTAPMLTFTGVNSVISNINFSSTTQNTFSSATVYVDIAAVPPGENYSTFTIDNVNFYNNLSSTTSALGGALHINSQQDTTLSNSYFSSNSALGTGAKGGALYYNGPIGLTIVNTNFSSNTVEQDGGAIYASTVTLQGSYLYGNTATLGDGGAIYASSITISSYTAVEDEIIKTSFINNYAEGNGGAIYITDYANIDNTTFEMNISTNSSAGLGGAIYAGVGATTTISGNFLINNGYDGAAIYNDGNMSIRSSLLNGNIAFSNGGSVYNSATGTMVISTSTFLSNRSLNHGGAIYTQGDLDIHKSKFSLNVAEGDGGAIYIDNATVNLYNAMEFTNNISTGTGGAIHITNGTLNIYTEGKDVTFSGNTDGAGSNSNDIFMDAGSTTNIFGGGKVRFYDGVVGGSITATNTDLLWYSTNAYDSTLTMTGGALSLLGANTTLGTVNLSGTAINAQNGAIDSITATAINLTGGSPVYVDVDPVSGTVDNFSGVSGGSLDINSYDQLNILLDQPGTSGNLIIAPGATVNVNTTEDFYGPLYIYNITPVAGGFQTVRSNRLNPTISTLPVAANAKTVSNMNTTASIFNRIDIMFSRDLLNYVRPENSQELDKGPYVDPEHPIKQGPVPTQSKHFMAWFIPNAGYQKVDYGGSINNVENVFYGGIIGVDFPFTFEEHSVFVPTLFMGYLGTTKKYEGVTTNNDSLAVGAMTTWQKEKVLLSAQMYVTNGPETYSFKEYGGSFDIFSYTAAVKLETGVELSDNVVLQPAVTALYNLSNLQNYTTVNGASMYSSRFHNILLTPSVKVMGSYDGWYPYLSLGYTFNALQKGTISADNLGLPEYKMKNIADVSVGLENTFWKDYSGYVQLSTYLGGARGLVFQMGLRGYIDF